MVIAFLGTQKKLGMLGWGLGVGGIGLLEGFFFLFLMGKNIFHVMYSDHTFPFSPRDFIC